MNFMEASSENAVLDELATSSWAAIPADSPIWMHGAVTRQEACANGVLLIARPTTRAFWMSCGKHDSWGMP